jgi:hypothetical protein
VASLDLSSKPARTREEKRPRGRVREKTLNLPDIASDADEFLVGTLGGGFFLSATDMGARAGDRGKRRA